MKKHIVRVLKAATLAAFFIASAAHAQTSGTVTKDAFAIGKGAGTTGYTSVLCGTGQIPIKQSGTAPACFSLSGDVTMDAAGVISIGAGKVTNSMLAGSIAASKLVGTDIATVGTITSGVWHGSPIDLGSYSTGTLPSARLAGSYTGVTGLGTVTTGIWNAGAVTSSGDVRAAGVVKPGAGTCNAGNIGALQSSGAALQVCDGTVWSTVGAGGSQWINGTGGAIYYNGGPVGIGMSTPSRMLDIKQTTDAVTGGVGIQNAAATKRLNLWVGTDDTAHIDNGGTPFLAMGSTGTLNVYANGNAYTWPTAQGPAGGTLTNNGSGVLSFQPGSALKPEMYGAALTANPAVDDTPFIQAAVNAVTAAGGGSVYLSRCYYLNSNSIGILNTSIKISGANSQTSCLIVTTTSGGISFVSNTNPSTGAAGYWHLALENFSIVAKDNGTTPTNRGDCIRAVWPVASDQLPKMSVRNVTCKSETYNAQYTYWNSGIRVSQADGFSADNFTWYQVGSTNGSGIWIDNSSNPSSYTYTINNMNANGGQFGIFTSGCLEALHILNAVLIAQRVNLAADATGCSNSPTFGHTVELQVVGGSWNAKETNILALYWNDISITGIEAGVLNGGVVTTDANYIAHSGNINISNNQLAVNNQGPGAAVLRIADSNLCTISSNSIVGGDTGIKLSQTSPPGIPGCSINGNTMSGANTAIDLTNSQRNNVIGNGAFAFTTGIKSTNTPGAGNVVWGNIISGAPTPYSFGTGTNFATQ